MKTKEYIAIKNFVHNELGLTKEDFNNILRLAIQDEAKAFVQRNFQDSDFKYQDLVKTAVSSEIKRILDRNQYGTTANKLYEFIGKELTNQFVITLKNDSN